MENRQSILKEIDAEREFQVACWGNKGDDTKNKPNDWVTYISHQSTRWYNGGLNPYHKYRKADVEEFRKRMIKTAAIAVAAVESLDRQIQENGRPFYQED